MLDKLDSHALIDAGPANFVIYWILGDGGGGGFHHVFMSFASTIHDVIKLGFWGYLLRWNVKQLEMGKGRSNPGGDAMWKHLGI